MLALKRADVLRSYFLGLHSILGRVVVLGPSAVDPAVYLVACTNARSAWNSLPVRFHLYTLPSVVEVFRRRCSIPNFVVLPRSWSAACTGRRGASCRLGKSADRPEASVALKIAKKARYVSKLEYHT